MKERRIVMYLGGFAKTGGIEAFARDFLLAIADRYPARELVMWGRRDAQNVLLQDIARSGAAISRSPWRWGCLWNLPDFVLAPWGLRAMSRAAAVVFKRPPQWPIPRLLRWAARRKGRRVPLILITPYSPKAYWGESPSASLFKDFDVITVQSAAGIAELREAGYRGRVENIPLLPPRLYDLAPFPSQSNPAVVRIGFLGRLAAQKNLGYLLEIFRELTRKIDPQSRYELHLFGNGAERTHLEGTSVRMDLQGVFFHGEVARAAVGDAIDSCDLFLNTSTTEGQCLAALEVLSRGRPLVATPVGALPDVLRDPELGLLAPLADAPAFAKTVARLARDIRAGIYTPHSVAGVFRVRFDNEAIRQRYLDLLHDVAITN